MVIIRVGQAAWAGQATHVSLRNTSIMMDSNLRAERGRRMQVRITRLTESEIDHGRHSPMGIASPSANKSGLDATGFDGGGEEV